MPRRATTPAKTDATWERFNAYLRPGQIEWMNRTVGRYMGETGGRLGSSDLLRIALVELENADWPRLKRVIDRYLKSEKEAKAASAS